MFSTDLSIAGERTFNEIAVINDFSCFLRMFSLDIMYLNYP